MKRAFALGATIFLLSTALSTAAMAQTYPGQEVTVNPGAFGNGYLLYPGGKYGRHVGPLLQPGEKLGVIHLHMPVKHRNVIAKRVKKKAPAADTTPDTQVASTPDTPLTVTSPDMPPPKHVRHAKAAPTPAPSPDTQFASAPDMNAPTPAPAKPARHTKGASAPADTQFASAPDLNMASAPAPAPRKAPPPPKPVKVAKAAPPPAPSAPPSDTGMTPPGDINGMPEDSAARLIAPDAGPNSPFATAPVPPKKAAPPPKPVKVAKAAPPPASNTPPPALAAGMRRQSSIPFAPGESSPAVSDVAAVHGLAASLNAALNSGAAKVQLDAFGGARGDKSSDAHRLSLKRALVIRELLIEDGVPAEKIDVRALGGADDSGPADRVDVYTHA